MPIVMGMVAGVFLRFGLDLVRALFADIGIAGPMVVVWLLLSCLPNLSRRCPPIVGALDRNARLRQVRHLHAVTS
jgi:benzoate membrane transport protein